MTTKKIKEQFINEYNSIMPDFDKILANINSVEVSLQPVVAPSKKRNPRFFNVWNRSAEVEAQQPKLKLAAGLMSMCICVMLIAVSMFYCGIFALNNNVEIELDKQADSYVSLNINPELDFAVNKFNKITTVKSKNESSKLLLSQLYKSLTVDTLVGMELNGALISVIDEASKMGYIDVSAKTLSNAIMIDVMGANATACADTKLLLAKEANGYFASKGILAVVVTNYDSKAALVAEARKSNPDISADASICELIGTVEAADGGKSMYEQEIERIKRENGDYSTFLDKDVVSRVQYAVSEKVYLYNDLISKQNKILATLDTLKIDLGAQINDKQNELNTLQAEIEEYQDAIDKINADPESYGDALALKQQIKSVNETIKTLREEIEKLKMQRTDAETEYKNKLLALQNSKTELQTALAQLENDKQAAIDSIRSKNSEITAFENDNKLKEQSIADANVAISGKNAELDLALQKKNEAQAAYDEKLKISSYHAQLVTVVDAMNSGIPAAIAKLKAEYDAKTKTDNCVKCTHEYTAMKVLERMNKDGALLYDLSKYPLRTINSRLTLVIVEYYDAVVKDDTIFTAGEIGYNETNHDTGLTAVSGRIIADLNKIGINEDIANLIQNLTDADKNIEALAVTSSGATLDVAALVDEKIAADKATDFAKHKHNVAVADYNAVKTRVTAEIDEINRQIAVYESDIVGNNLAISQLKADIISIEDEIAKFDRQIAAKNEEIVAKESEIIACDEKYADIDKELSLLLSDKYDEHDKLNEKKSQLKNDLKVAIAKNKALVAEFVGLIETNKGKLPSIIAEIEAFNKEIGVINQDINVVNAVIVGYNQIVNSLKTFSASYTHGMRFVCFDKELESKLNAEIQAIEDLILSLRSASEQEMQDSIKNNLDKMANAQLEKNIDKYNSHQESMTEEELNAWQSEQQHKVDEQGWESFYSAWLASQNN